MDIAAFVVAIVSAVLALGSLLVSWITLNRDSPKLKVSPNYTVSIDEPSEIGIDVRNVGKRATTIIKLGYRVEHNGKIVIHGKEMDFEKNISFLEQPIVLNPGEYRSAKMVLNIWPDRMVHADMYLRPFATDSHGKTSWGPSQPYLRRIITESEKIPLSTPPANIEPSDIPYKPKPIHAAWMIWKPKYLRKDISKKRP